MGLASSILYVSLGQNTKDFIVITSNIREHMEVFGSCGERVGIVDQIEGSSLKLTKNGPHADGEHHYIPLEWVETADRAVYLNKPCEEVWEEWQPAPIGAGGG